ncbi:probable E3 ubiquitin-protein ligase HERC4 isoform X2 [Acipenser ruthenus]|uniref:probable E3 ubiquitin-protein ligase HERC4 isoform X2 n=1 Tax=Acipenser ruthenus TaxID=7906 RepID=UPI002741EE77|nr:probable E3 ubiquitin-protein ligase HERC4 isoform X2 [Acipenser ruthenus]
MMMYTWGEANWTGLGLSTQTRDDDINLEDNYFHQPDSKNRIIEIACGSGVITFVKENGNGVMWTKSEKREPLLLRNEKILIVDCGSTRIVLVSETGQIFECNYREQAEVAHTRLLSSLSDRKIIQIACGNHHSLALSRDGQLFTWGQNTNGQLGLGKGEPSKPSPQPLKSLLGIPLAQIAAGGDHSFAVSVSGAVYAWGRNHAGQLGLGNTTDRFRPTLVKSLQLKKTVFISCGDEHTAILTKDGLVYTFGAGSFGQLGHNSTRNEVRPRLVAELWGEKVSQVACGSHHTVAYISSTNKVYSFGCGEQGQLGTGQNINQEVPVPLTLSAADENTLTVDKIVAGGNQTFVLISQIEELEPSADMFPSSTGKRISSINDNLLDKWISECESEWNNINNNDKHFKTTTESAGVDLSLVRLAFEKLAKNTKVLMQVESVVLNKLLPSLSGAPAGVEALRIYLIIPELFRVLKTQQSIKEVASSLAEAILRLQPSSIQILESLWSKLPIVFFRLVVTIYHFVSSRYLHGARKGSPANVDKLHNSLRVLQILYKVNSNAGNRIQENKFYIDEIGLCVQSIQQMHSLNLKLLKKQESLMTLLLSLTVYPCIFDFAAKCFALQCDSLMTLFTAALTHPFGENNLLVNRRNLLHDTLQYLRDNSYNHLSPLKVTFVDENGVDHGGLSQEFFSVITRELHTLEPGVFKLFEDSRLVWFIPKEHKNSDMFFLIGVLCGMALYNHCVADFHFPLALFKKLLEEKPTLEDLKELSPLEARSLQAVLDEDEDSVDSLDLDFTVQGHELVLNGKYILVTKYNRIQYVEAYVDFVFNKSVKKQFDGFMKGFRKGCPSKMWNIFLPVELMAVLNGNTKYEWEELEKNAKYKGYEPTDKNIRNFWKLFHELDEEQKKHFLAFLTASDRVPVGGMASLSITIMNGEREDPDKYYPVANTCYWLLCLPNYSSADILKEKFLHAITFYEGFGDY